MTHSISIVSTTVGSQEQARALAARIVESRLAGCVQIDGPIQSVYRWEGRVCDEPEYRLSAKTLPNKVAELLETIGQSHPYQTPELLISRVECSDKYFVWLQDQVVGEPE